MDKPTNDKIIIVLAAIWFIWICVGFYCAFQGKWPFWPMLDE